MGDNSFKVDFTATASKLDFDVVVELPASVSSKLSSRGMNSVEGYINGKSFISTLEPDGSGGHLLRMDKEFCVDVGVKLGDKVKLEFSPVKVESEPKIPTDLKKALEADLEARTLWNDITTLARRDWIHWIITAKQPATRARRVDQTRSKLKDGKRRPCCFNYQSAIVSYEPR